jgi:hypothetical protein
MISIDLPTWFPIQGAQFMLGGLFGLLANYLSLRGKGLLRRGLWRFLVVDSPGRTLASVLTLVAACFAAIAVGGLEEMKITTAVAAGFTSAWAIDAGVTPALSRSGR